jgi:tRNA pseudouridine13 synthase
MPGSGPFAELGETDAVTRRLMASDGVDEAGLGRAAAIVGTPFSGAIRAIGLAAEVEVTVAGTAVSLGFALGPGRYATTICREFMKADPLCMV